MEKTFCVALVFMQFHTSQFSIEKQYADTYTIHKRSRPVNLNVFCNYSVVDGIVQKLRIGMIFGCLGIMK